MQESVDGAWVFTGLGREAELVEAIERASAQTPWHEGARRIASGDLAGAAETYAEIGSVPDEVYARFGDRLVSAKMGSWREGLAATELFDQADEASFPHPHSIASSALSRLYATSSDVASLPPARRLRLLGAIDELGRRLPERLSIAASTCVEVYRGRP